MKKIAVVSLVLGFIFLGSLSAQAQITKPVVVLKGVVRSEKTGKAHSVKVSVRAENDKDVELTSSRSNSESGNYLVILQPNRKYWLHLEGEDILTKDELIETPTVLKTEQISKDLAVTVIPAPQDQQKASIN